MRIHYFIDEFVGPHSGTEKQLLIMIRELIAHGHDVKLFVLRETDYTQIVSDFPCPIECLNIHSLASFVTLARCFRWRRRIAADRPDVVHAFFNDCALLVPFLAPGGQCRVFTSRRDMGYWYSPAVLFGLRVANRFCTAVVCNSKAVAEHVARCERLAAHRTAVIYNGVEPAAAADESDGTRIEQIAGIPNINVCLIANIRPIKRIEDLVEAAAEIANSGRVINVYIAGAVLDRDYRNDLENLVERYGLQDKVHWTGSLDNPRNLMRRSTIGVLTSASEGFSNTLLEYFAEGLAVVCSDAGGNPELIRSGENGYLYSVGDVPALTSHLIKLADDAEKRRQFGNAARRHAERFTIDACITHYVDLYVDREVGALVAPG